MNEFKKRLIMCVTGVFLSGVAAGIFGFTAFGMDPFQVFAHGLWGLTPISFGTFYVILNGILLVFMFFFNRRMIGLGTIINLFLLGYVVEYTDVLLDRIFPSPSVFLRVLLMILALVLASLAASLYFVARKKRMGIPACADHHRFHLRPDRRPAGSNRRGRYRADSILYGSGHPVL